MTKLCSVCGTENRDEAKFCRACGTVFAMPSPRSATSDDGDPANTCAECGFRNKPGLRYCANCGVNLAASTAAGGDPAAGESGVGGSPPPISYPSFAPVGPYPPAPADDVPEIPDADAEIALLRQEAEESAKTTIPFENAPSRSRTPLVLGIVALVLVVAGVLAWTFMRDSNPSPPAISATIPPVAAPLQAPSAAASSAAVEATEGAEAAAAATSAGAAAPPPPAASEVPLPAATEQSPETQPAAAPPPPNANEGIAPASPAEIEAKRQAAEKHRQRAAREKAAREKAAREAKALAEQRERDAAAAQRAEQEAARRRAEQSQQRAHVQAAPPVPVAAPPRGVLEICAGRNTVSEAICRSLQCSHAEHAGEPICRQVREQEERRRNMQP